MRVSVRYNDTGYNLQRQLRQIGKKAQITYNGEIQYGAITADSDAGMLVRLTDPLDYDHERQCLRDEVVHGRVEIEIVDEVVL